jgi:tRNA pseudouridine38-40 synthase
MHLVLIIAYDGTAYYGWQATKEGPSLQQNLEHVLSNIFQEPITVRAASRTDRGVHAWGQVVDFVTTRPCHDLQQLIISLNHLLPPDIRCQAAFQAPSELFHPTLDSVRKTYQYNISIGHTQLPHLRFTHWHVHYPLDQRLLHETAHLLIGTHDFRGLCNRRTNLDELHTMRTVHAIDIVHESEQNTLTVSITADRFLYKMARTIVGTIVWVARGKTPISSVIDAIKTRKRALAGMTAPAHGLCLVKVHYPENMIFQRPVHAE